jgi:hypothetical protein
MIFILSLMLMRKFIHLLFMLCSIESCPLPYILQMLR